MRPHPLTAEVEKRVNDDRRMKLLRQLAKLESEQGSVEYINIGDAEDAETDGDVEHVAGNTYRLTAQGRAKLST